MPYLGTCHKDLWKNSIQVQASSPKGKAINLTVNPKSEYRNTKQYRMTNIQMNKTNESKRTKIRYVTFWTLQDLNFGFVSYLRFRVSYFRFIRVRHACYNIDFMSPLLQAQYQIIDSKFFRPEILSSDKNFQWKYIIDAVKTLFINLTHLIKLI